MPDFLNMPETMTMQKYVDDKQISIYHEADGEPLDVPKTWPEAWAVSQHLEDEQARRVEAREMEKRMAEEKAEEERLAQEEAHEQMAQDEEEGDNEDPLSELRKHNPEEVKYDEPEESSQPNDEDAEGSAEQGDAQQNEGVDSALIRAPDAASSPSSSEDEEEEEDDPVKAGQQHFTNMHALCMQSASNTHHCSHPLSVLQISREKPSPAC
jgi:hypothetical protein